MRRPTILPRAASRLRSASGQVTRYCFREDVKAALAHRVGDATERAYRRADALEKRRALMEAWAAHCEGGRKVIPFAAKNG